jgi:AcrR family transcriptional regulator
MADPSPTPLPTSTPSAGNRKAQQRELTRLRLVEAALTLFAHKGYDEATTSDIAALAGVTERTFFLHFAAKADAIIELTPSRVDELVATIEHSPPDLSLIAVLERVLISWIGPLSESDRDRVRLLLSAARNSSTIRGKQLEALDTLYEACAEALAVRAARKRATREMRVAAAIAIRLLHASLIEWSTSSTPVAFKRVAELHFTALRGLLPPAEDPRPGGPVGATDRVAGTEGP